MDFYLIDQRHRVQIFVHEFRTSFRSGFIETAARTGPRQRWVIIPHESFAFFWSTVGRTWQRVRKPGLMVNRAFDGIAFGHLTTDWGWKGESVDCDEMI